MFLSWISLVILHDGPRGYYLSHIPQILLLSLNCLFYYSLKVEAFSWLMLVGINSKPAATVNILLLRQQESRVLAWLTIQICNHVPVGQSFLVISWADVIHVTDKKKDSEMETCMYYFTTKCFHFFFIHSAKLFYHSVSPQFRIVPSPQEYP